MDPLSIGPDDSTLYVGIRSNPRLRPGLNRSRRLWLVAMWCDGALLAIGLALAIGGAWNHNVVQIVFASIAVVMCALGVALAAMLSTAYRDRAKGPRPSDLEIVASTEPITDQEPTHQPKEQQA